MGVVFYNKFLAICFDQEFAQLRGVQVNAYYLLLLCLTALTIVILVRVVGIVLVIALLTLPAAVAGHFSRQLWEMMVLAVGVCMIATVAGLAVSFQTDLPSGPVIIVFAAAAYLGVWVQELLKCMTPQQRLWILASYRNAVNRVGLVDRIH